MNSIATNPKKAAIAFIMVTIVLDVLSLGLIIPVGARLILDLVDGGKTTAIVNEGDVLLELRNRDLDPQIAGLNGELLTAMSKLNNATRSLNQPGVTQTDRDRFSQEIAESRQTILIRESQLKPLQEKKAKLVRTAAFYIGLFGTTWAFMQFFCSPIMGALSDRFGRRPILILSAFGLGFDYILLALAPNLAWLFLGRIITGITASSFSTAQAYLADVTKPEDRSAAFGMFGAAFGLGFVLGPAMGGVLSDFDLRLPFWVSAFLTLSNAMYGFFVLPESLPIEKRSSFRWARANPLGSLRLLRSATGLLPMAMTLFLYQLAHQVFQNVFILYTLNRFQWSGAMQGGTLAAVGILNFIVQGGLIRPAVKRFGERVLIFVGLSGGILGFLAYSIAWTDKLFFASTFIFALVGFFSASIQGVMSKKLALGQQGQLSGANSSLNGISGMIGPFLFTQVYSWSNDPNVPNAWQGAPFALSAAILGLSLVIAFIYVPKKS